jgi:hypothetical protein
MPRGIPNKPREQAPAQVQAPVEVRETQASPRAEETRRQRRRRDDGDLDRMGRMALAIPHEEQERLDREGKTARWVRDAPGRQLSMHQKDWDVTPNVEPVPEDREGEGKLVLMEKYRDWYDDDQRKKSNLLDEREAALTRAEGENRKAGDGLVVPKGQTNRISRERGL